MNSINKIQYYFKKYKDHTITLNEEYDCLYLVKELESLAMDNIGLSLGLDETKEIDRIFTKLFVNHQDWVINKLRQKP